MLKPKVEQVKAAFAELQTAADGLTVDNLRQKAPSIRAAMTQLRNGDGVRYIGPHRESCPAESKPWPRAPLLLTWFSRGSAEGRLGPCPKR